MNTLQTNNEDNGCCQTVICCEFGLLTSRTRKLVYKETYLVEVRKTS